MILHSALLLLALVSPCRAQGVSNSGGPRQDAQTYGRRTDAFRRLLFEFHFEPLPSFAELQQDPGESLFIMLGNPNCLSRRFFPEGLRSFVEQGGAVLIATDKETKGEAGDNLRDLAGVVVIEESIYCGDSRYTYGNSAWCPILEPIEDASPFQGPMSGLGPLAAAFGASGRPALFRNPRPGEKDLSVATNAPSRLKKRLSFWRPMLGVPSLARLPDGCEDRAKRTDPPSVLPREDLLFAVGGTVGKGRVLVLADHSIFINWMILPHDNGNLEFAANCLHWLRGGISSPMEAIRVFNNTVALQQVTGQRNKVLFWDDGLVRTDFEVPLKKVPLPPSLGSEPAVVAAIDKTIAKLEDEDYFNRQLFQLMDELPGGRQRVLRNVVYLLTLAAFLFLAYRFLWRSRHRPEYAVPLLADAISKHEPKASLLDQRRRALLRLGNVWEMGHRLARDCFESAGVALTGASPPRVVMAHGSWRYRWRVRRRVARLWQLACSDAPVPLSPAALQHRLRELEELKTALADGTIRLT